MKYAISYLKKGALRSKSSVVFWYFRISLRATVPGLYLRFFLSGLGGPELAALGAAAAAALGAAALAWLPGNVAVDVDCACLPGSPFLAVCFVRAIFLTEKQNGGYCQTEILCVF